MGKTLGIEPGQATQVCKSCVAFVAKGATSKKPGSLPCVNVFSTHSGWVWGLIDRMSFIGHWRKRSLLFLVARSLKFILEYDLVRDGGRHRYIEGSKVLASSRMMMWVSRGTSVKVWCVLDLGQEISSRSMDVASPRPIS